MELFCITVIDALSEAFVRTKDQLGYGSLRAAGVDAERAFRCHGSVDRRRGRRHGHQPKVDHLQSNAPPRKGQSEVEGSNGAQKAVRIHPTDRPAPAQAHWVSAACRWVRAVRAPPHTRCRQISGKQHCARLLLCVVACRLWLGWVVGASKGLTSPWCGSCCRRSFSCVASGHSRRSRLPRDGAELDVPDELRPSE